MTVMIILLSLAVAILTVMIYAGQCWTAELEDRIAKLEKKNRDTDVDIERLYGKTDRLAKHIMDFKTNKKEQTK